MIFTAVETALRYCYPGAMTIVISNSSNILKHSCHVNESSRVIRVRSVRSIFIQVQYSNAKINNYCNFLFEDLSLEKQYSSNVL